VQAVAFTGSLRGGKALQQAINAHPRRIPFYGELGSLNPIVAFPRALAAGGRDLADRLGASITLGAGQFCTSPGVLLVLEGPESRQFIDALADWLRQAKTHPMLTAGIRAAFDRGVRDAVAVPGVRLIAGGPSEGREPVPTLIEVPLATFLESDALREEVFGPFCLIVVARDASELTAALAAIGGSLTATIWASEEEATLARPVVAEAARIAGRLLFSGVPTGVAVTMAQQHGGPWPVSTRPDTTSVGMFAIERFLRPVCLQDLPDQTDLLPPGLRIAMTTLPQERRA
jgi:NADP-dependent aldehyde dehydrogenase